MFFRIMIFFNFGNIKEEMMPDFVKAFFAPRKLLISEVFSKANCSDMSASVQSFWASWVLLLNHLCPAPKLLIIIVSARH